MANIFEQPLELSQLLSHPFLAAVGADSNMAHSTVEFIRDVGFEVDENGNLGDAIMLEFNYEVTKLEDETADNLIQTTSLNTFRVPVLAIVNPPSLRIQRVEVDLVLEVNQLMEQTSSSNSGNIAQPRLYRALGRLSSDKKVETDASANYKVKMVAESMGENEALAEIMKALTGVSTELVNPAYVHINGIQASTDNNILNVELVNPIAIDANSKIRIELETVLLSGGGPVEIDSVINGEDELTGLTLNSVGNAYIIDNLPAITESSNIKINLSNINDAVNIVICVINESLITVQKSKKIDVL